MDNLKRGFLRFAVWVLILVGISGIWEFAEVAIYGYSQISVVDAIMAMFLADWIDSKIWKGDRNA